MPSIFDEYSLRPVEHSDLALLCKWRNLPHIRTTSFTDEPLTADILNSWFARISTDSTCHPVIFQQQDTPLGLVTFSHIARRHSRANWGVLLGSEIHIKGLGRLLSYFGIEYAFNVLGVRKLVGEILGTNTRSIRLHMDMGFVQEGHFRFHVRRNITANFEDVLVFALLKTEWQTEHRPRVSSAILQLECCDGK